VAAASEPKAVAAKIFAWLGAVSYPLYALHKPAGELVTLWVRHVAPQDVRNAWIGLVYLTVAVAACALIERFYDRPVRRVLTDLLDRTTGLVGRRAKPGTVAAGGLAADTSV
jgi:peptidoglycan/LPS O-acetylase OafA/YrhL